MPVILRSCFFLLVSALLMVASLPLRAADLEHVLQPFTAEYKGRANGMAVGNLGVRELKALGNDRYQLQYRAKAMIYTLEETSVFDVKNAVIQPISYRSSRGSFFNRRKTSMDFDWSKNKASYDYKGRVGSFELQPHTQDPLSGSLQLARLLTTEQTIFEYLEAEKRGIGSNQLKLIDQPALNTSMGIIQTWHLERIHRDTKRKTEIWLHKDYPAIPVKVFQLDDGDEFQLDLTRFTLQ